MVSYQDRLCLLFTSLENTIAKQNYTSFYADEHMIITEVTEITDCYVTGSTVLIVIVDQVTRYNILKLQFQLTPEVSQNVSCLKGQGRVERVW